MKTQKIIVSLAVAGLVLGLAFPDAPTASAQTSSTVSSLQSLITSLENQIAVLKTKIAALTEARVEMNTAAADVATTVKLIAELRQGAQGEEVRPNITEKLERANESLDESADADAWTEVAPRVNKNKKDRSEKDRERD